MKLADLLIPPILRKNHAAYRLRQRLTEFQDKLAETKTECRTQRQRAHKAEEMVKEMNLRYQCDPDRCQAAIESLLKDLPEPLQPHRQSLANVSPLIDPQDDMIWSANTASYFRVGLDAARIISTHATQHGRPDQQPPVWPQRILDFPCGHGRVMRWLRVLYPQAKLHGCDTQLHGMEFCEEHFAARPISPSTPPALPQDAVGEGFDLIWVGSLLTHLREPDFRGFLQALPTWLAPGGLAFITTHGQDALQRYADGAELKIGPLDDAMRRELEQTGFFFRPYRKTAEYGVSFSTDEYVRQRVREIDSLTIEARDSWVGFQDVWVCRRAP